MMKRFFRGKKRTKKPIAEGGHQVLEDNANHIFVPAGNKNHAADKHSCDSSKDSNTLSNLRSSAIKKASKLSFRSSPKRDLGSKEVSKNEVHIMVSELQNQSQKNRIDSATDPPGKRGSVLKRVDDDKSVASSTKSGSEGTGKKVNFTLNRQVEEVVVPQSGVANRHSSISRAYDSIPLLEQTKLPRGGISVETKAVGRVQVR